MKRLDSRGRGAATLAVHLLMLAGCTPAKAADSAAGSPVVDPRVVATLESAARELLSLDALRGSFTHYRVQVRTEHGPILGTPDPGTLEIFIQPDARSNVCWTSGMSIYCSAGSFPKAQLYGDDLPAQSPFALFVLGHELSHILARQDSPAFADAVDIDLSKSDKYQVLAHSIEVLTESVQKEERADAQATEWLRAVLERRGTIKYQQDVEGVVDRLTREWPIPNEQDQLARALSEPTDADIESDAHDIYCLLAPDHGIVRVPLSRRSHPLWSTRLVMLEEALRKWQLPNMPGMVTGDYFAKALGRAIFAGFARVSDYSSKLRDALEREIDQRPGC